MPLNLIALISFKFPMVGGSLTVQIFGSASKSNQQEQKGNKKGEKFLDSDKKNGFPTSPITVRSRGDPSDVLK